MGERRINASPLVASSGLPAWATVVCDALLGAGIVDADDLEPLRVHQLTALAASYLRATAAGQPFDAHQAIEQARTIRYAQRATEREAA